MFSIPNFIDGKFREPASGGYLDDVDPATGQAYARVADSDSRDVDAAVQAAQRAFPAWARTPAAERSRLLLAIAQRIEDNLERLAQAECVDTGNTAVAKPSELTPMTAHLLAELCQEAGLPPGVLNIVHGLGNKVGSAIVGHPLVRTISFTGGTATGADIARTAAPLFKKVTLE